MWSNCGNWNRWDKTQLQLWDRLQGYFLWLRQRKQIFCISILNSAASLSCSTLNRQPRSNCTLHVRYIPASSKPCWQWWQRCLNWWRISRKSASISSSRTVEKETPHIPMPRKTSTTYKRTPLCGQSECMRSANTINADLFQSSMPQK